MSLAASAATPPSAGAASPNVAGIPNASASTSTVEAQRIAKELGPLADNYLKLLDFLMHDFGGLSGPSFIPMKHLINFQKGGTLILCLYLMAKYDNYSLPAVTYTISHGSYGLAWLLKELVFPDPKWAAKTSLLGALTINASVLLPYWLMPYWLISRAAPSDTAPHSKSALIAAAIVYVLGLVTMIGADCQKYFVLKAKKGLITDGFFGRCRHPNYLGEMMVYGSFAFQSGEWASAAIVGWVWGGVFVPFMLRKEASMSRYPEWAAYKKKSGFLIPKFW